MKNIITFLTVKTDLYLVKHILLFINELLLIFVFDFDFLFNIFILCFIYGVLCFIILIL